MLNQSYFPPLLTFFLVYVAYPANKYYSMVECNKCYILPLCNVIHMASHLIGPFPNIAYKIYDFVSNQWVNIYSFLKQNVGDRHLSEWYLMVKTASEWGARMKNKERLEKKRSRISKVCPSNAHASIFNENENICCQQIYSFESIDFQTKICLWPKSKNYWEHFLIVFDRKYRSLNKCTNTMPWPT